jgi:hypothetical protein
MHAKANSRAISRGKGPGPTITSYILVDLIMMASNSNASLGGFDF